MIAALSAFTTSPHARAHLASALLAAQLLVLIGAGLYGCSEIEQQSARLEDRTFELQSIAARLKTRGPGLARAERTLSADPFLPGATPILAANAMQRRIVALAESCGVTLKTIGTEPSSDTDRDALPHVTLQATASARIAGLQKLVYRIETEAPFVLVDEVSLRGPQATAAGTGTEPSLDPELEVELRLIGYLHRKEG
jgi:hypothetical protein